LRQDIKLGGKTVSEETPQASETQEPAPEPVPETQQEPPEARAEDEKKPGPSFWATLPGILTGVAAMITAIGGIVTVLITAGVLRPDAGATPLPATLTVVAATPTVEDVVRVESSTPRNGATGVDAALTEVVIVFNQPMRQDSWSFVVTDAGDFPEVAGDPSFRDARTCGLPVKLEKGKTYAVGVNSAQRKGFVSAADGTLTAEPCILVFKTAP
jgi:RNA polymerase sigma-70 factor (ECF subfamily)